MTKDREFIVDFEMFHYDLVVVFTDNITAYAEKKKWTKFLLSLEGKVESAEGLHTHVHGRSWIFLKHDPHIRTIAHETYHCVDQITKFMGAEHEPEMMAYMIGHIVEKITDNLYKYGDAYAAQRKLNKQKKSLTARMTKSRI